MAVLREGNWLGNQRVDIPHLRAVESAVRGDFDLLAGSILAGKAPLITSGFYLITAGVSVATNLKLQVADGSLIHFMASESGSIFHVPADRDDEQLSSTNPRVLGSFTPSQVNYVGLDFVREADDTTVDLVEFIDSVSEQEVPVSVPLARTVDYRIVISTLDFDNNPGIAPIAKVEVDSAGNIVTIEDARNHFFRLGSGGTVPDSQHSFPWPAGRNESLIADTFAGGDKAINSFKSWMDSIMSRLWEVGGGEYWYSPTTYANERLARTGSPFVSNGEYFEWDGTNLHWRGLVWIFANSTATFNAVANQTTSDPGLTDLADGECIYVDVDRTQDLSGGDSLIAVKGVLAGLGSPEIPGSRYVLAWRYGANIFTRDQSYATGASFKLATDLTSGTVKLSAENLDNAADPRVAAVNLNGKAIATGISRGNGFVDTGSSTEGAGTLTIGRQINDTAVSVGPGNTGGPVNIESISDDLSILASDGRVLIEATSGVSVGNVLVTAARDVIVTAESIVLDGRIVEDTLGANIAEASTLTPAKNLVFVTFTGTGVNYITTTGWFPGTRLYLRLAAGVVVTHSAGSVPVNTANILLKAGVSQTSDSTGTSLLEVIYDGAHWVEPGIRV